MGFKIGLVDSVELERFRWMFCEEGKEEIC
jgi:hypothetical protein